MLSGAPVLTPGRGRGAVVWYRKAAARGVRGAQLILGLRSTPAARAAPEEQRVFVRALCPHPCAEQR